MNSVKIELHNGGTHSRQYLDKLEHKPSLQSQRERNEPIRPINRQQILHESITRSKILNPVKSRKRLSTVRKLKHELWSLGDYEHFWDQIDDLRTSYNDQPEPKLSNTINTVLCRGNSIKFGSNISSRRPSITIALSA